MSSASDDDVVFSKRPKNQKKVKDEESDDEDIPLGSLSQASKTTKETSGSESEDDEIALSQTKKRKPLKQTNGTEKKRKLKNTSKISKSASSMKKSTSNGKPTTNGKVKKEETPKPEDDEDVYKWWENIEDEDDTIKWETFEHQGVIFPPEYEPLPLHIKMYYDEKPVNLPPPAEEVAGFFAALIQTDHGQNPVFQKNFFHDFLEVLKESGGCDVEIKEFSRCDFTKMFEYFELKKEEKKNMTKAEKLKAKQEKEALEEPYKICLLNGRKEQVGNFRVEPPGLFRGRGAHPKTGKLKRRVTPEEIILNLSKDAKVPPPPEGHKWGEIRHDNTVSWLAMWRENVLNNTKYVRFAANSSLKGISDYKKFEKARELVKHIDRIRNDYKALLKDNLMHNRQLATATYLIDVFALRAGGEKSEEEADTVGCCSLRYEHITLSPPNKVTFDFLGKDSIRFFQEVEVTKQVFKNLKIFKKEPKRPGDALFDRIDPSILNKHFQTYMPGLTAKVFRTYNASKTMQDQMDLIPNEGTVAEKVMKFNAANRTVAILCNHQRSTSKGHATAMQKISDKIKEMEWRKIRFKKMIKQLDKSYGKKHPGFFEELDDITQEDEATIHRLVIERENEKIEKKFKKDNEKRLENNEKPLPESALKEELKSVKTLEKEYAAELKSGKPVVASTATVDKLEAQIVKLTERIANTSLQMKDKEDNSQVALSTSKINYIDPRLSVMFCKKYDVPIEKVFTKTLRDKFKWAIESVDENWRFY